MESLPGYDSWKQTPPPDDGPCPDCIYDEAERRVIEAVRDIICEHEGGPAKLGLVYENVTETAALVADLVRDLAEKGPYCRRHTIDDWD